MPVSIKFWTGWCVLCTELFVECCFRRSNVGPVLTSFYQGVEEMRATEDKLWELCQSFKDGQLINLVLAHNIVANMKREDFQAAR